MLSLGISCNHDAGVTVLEGDEILYAANEERFTRKKFDFGFPTNALIEALEVCNNERFDAITLDGKKQTPHPTQMNLVFTNRTWMSRLAESQVIARPLFGTNAGVELSRVALRFLTNGHRKYYRNCLARMKISGRVYYAEHHEAHAASAAMLFPSDTGLAITVDAFGEGICAGIWDVRNGRPHKRSVIPGYHSVGMLYLYITNILGFKAGQEGKVTGLAAHGDGSRVVDLLLSRIAFNTERNTFVNLGLGYGLRSVDALKRDLVGFSREDIAAGAQAALEHLVLSYVRAAILANGSANPRLFLAGGVFANVSLNRRIAEELPVESVAIAPNMGDGGLSLGSALLNHDQYVKFTSLYLGTDLARTTARVPTELLNQIKEIETPSLETAIAELLVNGRIIAVARDRMEYGPRALGNRSILAPAVDKSVNDSLNERLRRSEFMPFAPIVRDIDADDYFDLTQPMWTYENMTITCFVKDRARRECPAVVHVDGTARPQVLTKQRNPFIYEVLERYKRLSGIGVLINTSFNMHEEPIVRDAETAIRSFLSGGLDGLVLSNRLFVKK
jgi:carbamoyltransferase